MATDFCRLDEAVARHVRPGDAIHVMMGHSRWSALVREIARQHWGRPPAFTLIMASLSSLGAVLFRAGCLERVVTVYSGDSFPVFTPNPVFQQAYGSGAVQVENWSFLSFIQRLRAAATGVPAVVTGSVRGSSMAANDAYDEVDTRFGRVGLVAPLAPDIAVVHAAVADRRGNLAIAPPMFEGSIGAFAARRGVLATVEKVVDDLRAWSPLVRIPAHRVLAVVEAPFGAHPGGVFAGPAGAALPVRGYAEDVPFWIDVRTATRSERFDDWIREWILEPADHEAYLAKLGGDRLAELVRAAGGPSLVPRGDGHGGPPTPAERAAVWLADLLGERIAATGADAVLAGAGLANLAAWVGVARSKAAGHEVALAAELGLWDYTPTPGDPFIFSFANFPTASMLLDTEQVLGTLVNGPRTRSIACVGAAEIDRHGNINTTKIAGGPHLVGSGGANDVVTNADETLVVGTLSPRRFIEQCDYVTSPGARVRAVVTDAGTLTMRDGDLVLTHVAPGPEALAERIAAVRARCGWDLKVAEDVRELRPVTAEDVAELRDHDREGLFLGRDRKGST
ncbi:CoA-transferase [Amycolatopsis thermophila]|uniref:Acyl CoA:acetate/3-ketoacid CoA transferase alpha subunit n=1 Tax=Amycolatopsis thermophila TaxID=206084 RepID=A0ABU0F4S7_9PSEU|nr:CoA-transferase [Amycolatopsis thermophila]MDQ0382541.1 acyl CoA:acetate/3-ketoacid CoA transferase alpha subunit [Amycolatopsis thermophila]